MKKLFVLSIVLSLCSCAAFAVDPAAPGAKSPAEKVVGPFGDVAGATGTPWGLLAMSLFGSGGAVFTVAKTVNRFLAARTAAKAAAVPAPVA